MSAQLNKRVYAIFAADTTRECDQSAFTETVRKDALGLANPRKIHNMPGVHLFFIGMRLLLFSKKCARLSLMNGSPYLLEDIIFAPQEPLPDQYDVVEIIVLRFMPVALLLRAEGAKWILPKSQLPA